MAWTGNFKTQIEDLAGTLTVTDDAATQQWILDGCYDVLRKAVAKYGPEEVFKFSAKSGNQTSNNIDVDEIREITGVFRNGIHAVKGAWHLKAKYADSGSIYAATANDPVWYLDDSSLDIYPAPDDSGPANYYYIPEYSLTNWDTGTSSVNHYPSEYYYHAMLYASIQVLFRKMVDKSAGIAALNIEGVISAAPTLASAGTIATVSYSAPSTTSVADVNEMLVEDIATVSDATTSAISQAASTTWADYFPGELGDNDPGTFSTSASVPSAPTLSAQAVAAFSGAPVYTAPAVGGTATEVTAITALDGENTIDDFDGNAIEVDQWFATLSHLIEDEEDVELAQAQIQKISTYLNAYSQAMQNQLNIFNDANVEYQADIQHKIKEADLLDANESRSLQKYSAEVQAYQAQVNTDVQTYQQKISRYQIELQTTIQAWQAEYGALVQEATLNAQAANQAALQNMQKDLQISQANLQKSQAEASTNHSAEVQQAQTNANLAQAKLLQDAIQTTQAIIANNNAIIQEHQSNLSEYQTKMDREVKEYQINLEKDSLDYNWIEKQYSSLKQEYYMAFAMPQQAEAE